MDDAAEITDQVPPRARHGPRPFPVPSSPPSRPFPPRFVYGCRTAALNTTSSPRFAHPSAAAAVTPRSPPRALQPSLGKGSQEPHPLPTPRGAQSAAARQSLADEALLGLGAMLKAGAPIPPYPPLLHSASPLELLQ